MSIAPALTGAEVAAFPQRTCSGPLEFLSAILQRITMNASLRFEAIEAIDAIRLTLEMREQHDLEYLFARCIIESCFAPASGGERTYDFLVDRFRSFDRRRQEMTIPGSHLPLVCREMNLRHMINVRQRRVSFFRAIHLAAALDCDGPSSRSEEKQAIFAIFSRVFTGAAN